MRWLPVSALLAAVPISAHATQYATPEQAQRLLFPAATAFTPADALLTDAQRDHVAQASGARVRDAHVRAWVARDVQGAALGRVILDEVTGKHDLITYVVGIDLAGAVTGVEILVYRENHGGEIRQAAWREGFRGKRAGDPVTLGADIVNISGATLSCAHVTDGVRRLLQVDAALGKAR